MADLIPEVLMSQSILKALRTDPGGWLAYTTHDSRRYEKGFPDVNEVELRPPYRTIYLELKTDTGRIEKGKWSRLGKRWIPGQDDWAQALIRSPGVLYFLIRPVDLHWLYQWFIDADAPHPGQGGEWK
ncbi:MAG: hypothetical protein H8E48_05050 [Chloroflexi bacterium]|nr:hypothetical protein [Chloroflexota bacterium]